MSARPACRRASSIRSRSPPWRRSASTSPRHKPITFEELEDLEGLNFDLIVTLSPPAHHKALELTRDHRGRGRILADADPTGVEGNREQRLDAYRAVRDQLMARIRARFGQPARGNE